MQFTNLHLITLCKWCMGGNVSIIIGLKKGLKNLNSCLPLDKQLSKFGCPGWFLVDSFFLVGQWLARVLTYHTASKNENLLVRQEKSTWYKEMQPFHNRIFLHHMQTGRGLPIQQERTGECMPAYMYMYKQELDNACMNGQPIQGNYMYMWVVSVSFTWWERTTKPFETVL